MSKYVSTGPTLSAMPDSPEITAVYEAFNLWPLRPKVYQYDKSVGVLPTVARFPNASEASPALPEVVQYTQEMPAVDAGIDFPSFMRGVACVALIVPPEHHGHIGQAVEALAVRLMNGGELPALSMQYQDELRASEQYIFGNGEPITYRRLLAFMQGAFWLLTFIQDPRRKRHGVSPADYVAELVRYWAQRGVTPE